MIGGGYIGLRWRALRERDLAVTLVELAPQVMVLLEMAAPPHDSCAALTCAWRPGDALQPRRRRLTAHLSDGETVTVGLATAIGVRPDVAREAGLQPARRHRGG